MLMYSILAVANLTLDFLFPRAVFDGAMELKSRFRRMYLYDVISVLNAVTHTQLSL